MSPQHHPPDAGPGAGRYTLTMVMQLTGVERETLVQYCEEGLLPFPAAALEATEYDDATVCTIRRIELLREKHGLNLAGIRMIHALLAEVERLRRELDFRREAR